MSYCWKQAVPAFVWDSGLRCKAKAVYPVSQIEGCHFVLSDHITFTSCLGDVKKLYWHLYGILDSDEKWSKFILFPRLKVVILYYPILSPLTSSLGDVNKLYWYLYRILDSECKVKPVNPFSQIEGSHSI